MVKYLPSFKVNTKESDLYALQQTISALDMGHWRGSAIYLLNETHTGTVMSHASSDGNCP